MEEACKINFYSTSQIMITHSSLAAAFSFGRSCMHPYRGCTPLRSRASLDLGSLESWGCVSFSPYHHGSSTGCFPDGICALLSRARLLLGRDFGFNSQWDKGTELRWEESRRWGKDWERREELLSLHARDSLCRVGDSVFGLLLPWVLLRTKAQMT